MCHTAIRRLGTARVVACALALLSACVRPASLDALHPIPESVVADTSHDVRGDATAARVLSWDDQLQVLTTLVRGFFRPTEAQIRLIDPRPLADTRAADDSVPADDDWAAGISHAIGLRRVCPADDDVNCIGKPGGLLRVSRPYAAGRDTAIVYVVYTALTESHRARSGLSGEMRFTLARHAGEWRIASRLNAVGPSR